ncbi:MAG: hypothetical protein IKS48_07570 [Eubacterium sp.]|nr:hypothetical protein [Eubacterium sp.]
MRQLFKDLYISFKEITLEYIKSRVFPVTLLIIVLFITIINRLFTLQIEQGEDYLKSFEVRSEKTLTVDSIRGNIYDVNGNLLAYNEIAYTLTFGNSTALPETAKSLNMSENQLKNRIIANTYSLLKQNGDDIDSSFNIRYKDGKFYYNIEGVQLKYFLKDVYERNTINDLKPEEASATAEESAKRLMKLFDIGNEYDDITAYKILCCRYNLWLNRYQQYVPVEIAHNISEKSRAAISENRDNLLGMEIKVTSSRHYNEAKYFSQIIGYVGKASQEDIDNLNEKAGEDIYDSNDVVGKEGIERVFEQELHGVDGERTLIVDNLGKVLEVHKDTASTAGNDIYLTIDTDLQKFCYDMLEKKLATLLIAHISQSPESSKEIISINDVYSSFFFNNLIKLDRMKEDNASALEKNVYKLYKDRQSSALASIEGLLTNNPVALKDLDSEYSDYCEYICEMLSSEDIYNVENVDQTSDEFTAYTSDQTSLQDFLHYLISVQAIDVTPIEKENQYYDSDEMYDILIKFIIEYLHKDKNFDKRVIKNMVHEGSISGYDVVNLLYDQGILKSEGDAEYERFRAGVLSPFDFMITKIKSLEITPGMLNLSPCSGAVVVTDVNTGEVRAMVSYPSYDNNMLTNSVDPEYFEKINEDPTSPLLNRATNMKIAPGSTFKPISAIAGVSEGVLGLNEMIEDLGVFKQVPTQPKCWAYRSKPSFTHGLLDIPNALDVSCNYFFFTVGYRLATRNKDKEYNDNAGLAGLKKYGAMFGLTSKSGVEIYEATPHFSTRDAVTSAIGQGEHNFTPVQLSRYVSTIANGGTCYNLTLMNKITDYEGNVVKSSPHTIASQVNIDSALWDSVHYGMRLVVSNDERNKKFLNSLNVNVAGKTGTAQETEDKPDHGLFISYAPYEAPEVSVTTVIPNGYKAGSAVDLSSFVYAYLYDKEALNDATFNTSDGDVQE